MPPLYEYHDRLMKGKISRRDFVKACITAGVSTPLLMSSLTGCTTEEAATTALSGPPIGPFSMPEGVTKEMAQANPLVFQVWEFMPDMVAGFARTFEQQYDEVVEFSVIPGDYGSVMINKLLSGARLDILYTADTGPKFFKAGWLMDLSELWNIDEIQEACTPGMWEAMTMDGAVIGLPYFSAVKGTVFTNEILREKAGLIDSSYPKTYSDLWDECKQIKKDGVIDYPYLPFWGQAYYGIVRYFTGECKARGDDLWDKDHNAIFDVDTPAAEVLEDWRMLYAEELVPPGALTWADADRVDAFNSGQHVYAVFNDYDLQPVNDPTKSTIAGSVKFIPYQGQPWGELDYGLYSVVVRKDADKQFVERQMRLANFLGYKDKNGKFLTAIDWAKAANLGTAYAEVYDDPEVNESYKEWMPDYPKMKDDRSELFNHASACWGWKALWFPDWNAAIRPELAKAIIGEKSVKEVITFAKETWQSLKEIYA